MSFLSWVYEQKLLETFDSSNSYWAQGGFIERYLGVYSALRNIDELEVNHFYNYYKKWLHKLLTRPLSIYSWMVILLF